MFSDRTNWRLEQNRYTQALDAVRAQGVRLLDLTASNPTRVGLRYNEEAILAALRSKQSMDYDPQAKGLLSAREAVARYYAERCSAGAPKVDPEKIVLTTSTSEGYSFVFRLLCNAGDELLVPKPSYPLFEFLADLQDVKLVPYPLIYDHGWQIDFHSLEKSVTLRTRGVVLVHPNNPTGSYVHASEISALNELCRANGLALIADEVFLDYELQPSQPDATARNERAGSVDGTRTFTSNQQALTFTLSGLSKISALPQMKVAWTVTTGPTEQVAAAIARLEVIADTYLSMNAPVQGAVPVMLEQRKTIQQQLLARVHQNIAELDRQLAAQHACQRLALEGGWYAILRVPVTRSDEELAIELVQQKSVLVHPGHFYDFPSDGYVVLSLISPEAEFTEGVKRVLAHLNS